MTRLQQCVDAIVREEGGLVAHPADPGGRTNLGITQRTLYRARAMNQSLPVLVDGLTAEHAGWIYARNYWAPAHCYELPPGLDLLVLDAAVQHDPNDAVQLLQLALKVGADGVFGSITRAALAKVKDVRALAQEFTARNLYFYMNLDAIDQTFGLGWARRVLRIHAQALAALPTTEART